MRPELVTALVAYLSHQDCAVSGESFAVAGGRVARILMGETQGFIDRQLTPERVSDAIAAGRDAEGFTPFADYVSSAALLMDLLGHAPGEPLAPLTYSKPGD